MTKCFKCDAHLHIEDERRQVIRDFMSRHRCIRQHEIAQVLGISQSRVSEIINNVRKVSNGS